MSGSIKWTLAAALVIGGLGCSHYEDQRPDVASLDSRDSGLQSKDVIDASDKMAASILGDADFNARPTQMLLVVGDVNNKSTGGDPRSSYQIFLNRLRVQLQRNGKGRMTLIMNKAELQDMQSKELDQPAGDEFGQGGNTGKTLPGRVQADYMLNATITDLPNRGTDYYYFDFKIFGLKGPQSGVQVWADGYEVKVAN